MVGRIKYSWQDNTPEGNTFGDDIVLASVRNLTQSTDYTEQQIGVRADEEGYYNDVTFNFQDQLFTLYNTRNNFEGTQSEAQLETLSIRELDNVSMTSIVASLQQIKFDWLLVGSEYQITDMLYIRVENLTTSNLRKRWAFGGLAYRDALTATKTLISDSFGEVGDTLEVSYGWISEIGEYSPLLTETTIIQDKSLWIQGDGFDWIQGDGNKWLYEP